MKKTKEKIFEKGLNLEQRRQRQAEGIAEAKKKGVRLGRPPTPLPENFQQVRLDWRSKKLTLQQAADACSMPVATFYAKAVRAGQGLGVVVVVAVGIHSHNIVLDTHNFDSFQ